MKIPSIKRGFRGVSMRIYYNANLKEKARQLRNNSTKAEIRLWMHLRDKKIMGYDFHRQKPIGNYIADFFCPKLNLAIEVDGYTHRFEEVVKKDHKKQDYIEDLGITVLRFKDGEIFHDIDSVLNVIKQYIVGHTSCSPLFRGEGHTPDPSC
ncbi:MAG: endonuclease domain-containing protein [Candidatus Edwardsbacteria bacterium]|nr:endonuclease domain-containing protein [Candidatus Edwardsbacteria bacterium]